MTRRSIPGNGETFEEAYERGGISHTEKRIYDLVRDGYVALHEIKALGGFGKEDKLQFDWAQVELQMGMFITITGRKQKKNKYGIRLEQHRVHHRGKFLGRAGL